MVYKPYIIFNYTGLISKKENKNIQYRNIFSSDSKETPFKKRI